MKEKKVATIFDLKRFCTAHSSRQGVCGNSCPFLDSLCPEFDNPDEANKIILDWCEKHPVKTRISELLKVYPNVSILNDGVPKICPKTIDETLEDVFSCNGVTCLECKKKYWTEEIK